MAKSQQHIEFSDDTNPLMTESSLTTDEQDTYKEMLHQIIIRPDCILGRVYAEQITAKLKAMVDERGLDAKVKTAV